MCTYIFYICLHTDGWEEEGWERKFNATQAVSWYFTIKCVFLVPKPICKKKKKSS